MNSQLTTNWKRAQELAGERAKLDGDLVSLQEELRHLSTTINKKIAAKEQVVAELMQLQEATSKLVATGEWVLKNPPVDALSGIATSGQAPIISKTLNENPVWNFVKEKFVQVWNFFFNRPKVKKPSETPVSQPDSSIKAI